MTSAVNTILGYFVVKNQPKTEAEKKACADLLASPYFVNLISTRNFNTMTKGQYAKQTKLGVDKMRRATEESKQKRKAYHQQAGGTVGPGLQGPEESLRRGERCCPRGPEERRDRKTGRSVHDVRRQERLGWRHPEADVGGHAVFRPVHGQEVRASIASAVKGRTRLG